MVCKERGLGVGMLGYRAQFDNSHLAMLQQEVEDYSLLEQVGYQVVIMNIDMTWDSCNLS